MMECEIMNSILTSTVGLLFSPRSPTHSELKPEAPSKVLEVQDSMNWISTNGKKWLEEAMARLHLDYSKVNGKFLMSKTMDELLAEKNKVKGELKRYDANFVLLFRRQPGRVEKEPMRPLYVYYKKLKQALTKCGTAPHSVAGGSSSLNKAGPHHRVEPNVKTIEKEPAKVESKKQPVVAVKVYGEWTFRNNEEIQVKITELKAERSQLRGVLDKFQQEFIKAYNRKIKYNKDIAPVAGDFKRYKDLKKIIVKLEELLK